MMRQTLLSILHRLGVFVGLRWLYRHRILVLCYHGGARARQHRYNGMLFMQRATFAQRLDLLIARGLECMTLDELLTACQAGARPPRAGRGPRFVLTFDDGWSTTFSDLIPEVQSRGLSATVYLHTRPIVEQAPLRHVGWRYALWTDYAQRLGRDLPAMDAWPPDDPKKQLEKAADELAQKGDDPPLPGHESNDALFRYATQGTLTLVQNDPSVSLQAHGRDHSFTADSPESLKLNVEGCLEDLRSLGLGNARHYCYPSGQYDAQSGTVLSGLGLQSATTCNPGWIDPAESANLYYLPRFLDSERFSELEFEAEISGFMDIMRRLKRRLGGRDSR
jgi:peptidoglycan/xylan/chitin deacetylase (PgdA/CDA1 family)